MKLITFGGNYIFGIFPPKIRVFGLIYIKSIFQHAPGIPKVLVGNRLHLAFKRQVHQEEAEEYAEKHSMGFFEVSPLVNFNISETLVELARMALRRNGMERWNGRSNKGELICTSHI